MPGNDEASPLRFLSDGQCHDERPIFSPYTKIDQEDASVISVTFDQNKHTAKVAGAACAMHSGAACGGEADTVRCVNQGPARR